VTEQADEGPAGPAREQGADGTWRPAV